MKYNTKNGSNGHGVVKGARPLLYILSLKFGATNVTAGRRSSSTSSRVIEIEQQSDNVIVTHHVDGAAQSVKVANATPTEVLMVILKKYPPKSKGGWVVRAEGAQHTSKTRAP